MWQVLGPDLRSRLLFLHSKLEIATRYLEMLANRYEPLDKLPKPVATEIEIGAKRLGHQSSSGLSISSSPLEIMTPSPKALELGGEETVTCCGGESIWLVLQRWKKLTRDFYNKRKDKVRVCVLCVHMCAPVYVCVCVFATPPPLSCRPRSSTSPRSPTSTTS